MGLDMYLKKKTYLGAEYKHNEIGGVVKLEKSKLPIKIKLNRLETVVESVGYWRKANHIHTWFVKNVQNEEDDCDEYYVTVEKLIELRNLCRRVIRCKSKESMAKLLPTQAGFFFGTTDYEESYIRDCKNTIAIITPLLKEIEADKENNIHSSIFYTSSW